MLVKVWRVFGLHLSNDGGAKVDIDHGTRPPVSKHVGSETGIAAAENENVCLAAIGKRKWIRDGRQRQRLLLRRRFRVFNLGLTAMEVNAVVVVVVVPEFGATCRKVNGIQQVPEMSVAAIPFAGRSVVFVFRSWCGWKNV